MKRICCLLTLCLPLYLGAQTGKSRAVDSINTSDFASYFRSPLDIDISLSGNYGEFRPNHFHAGYDFRTQGAVGAKLYAVAEGYISRVSVSPGGYGNAVYIVHPNGTTTVYGHLLDFARHIQDYVNQQQYEKKSFAVDLPLPDTLFPVKKGDLIGRTGNSGSSGGPHLHFEVRNTTTQQPLNYSAYGLYPVSDKTPPRLSRLQFYSYTRQAGISRTGLMQSANLGQPNALIPVSDTFYVAIGAYDKMENSNGLLSLALYELYIDDEKIFSFQKKEVPPARTRHVNAVIQYSQQLAHSRSLLKTWLQPGNLLHSHYEAPTKGLFSLPDSLPHVLRMVLTDDYGNQSESTFKVARRAQKNPSRDSLSGRPMFWALPNYYETEGCYVFLPLGALLGNIDFNVRQIAPSSAQDSLFYAPIWQVHEASEALMRPIRLRINASRVPEALRSKALVVSVRENGSYSSVGGKWVGEDLEVNVSQFGRYSVAIDTVPPSITPLFQEKTNMRGVANLRFRIGDRLSGIASYEGYIDGEWVLFSYDAKYGTISYVFDKSRIARNKRHHLELRVRDGCKNERVYTHDFEW